MNEEQFAEHAQLQRDIIQSQVRMEDHMDTVWRRVRRVERALWWIVFLPVTALATGIVVSLLIGSAAVGF